MGVLFPPKPQSSDRIAAISQMFGFTSKLFVPPGIEMSQLTDNPATSGAAETTEPNDRNTRTSACPRSTPTPPSMTPPPATTPTPSPDSQFQASTPRSTTRAVSEGILLELHHGWDEEESRLLILDLFLVNSRSINELLT